MLLEYRGVIVISVNLHLVVIANVVGLWADRFEKYPARFAARHEQQVFVENKTKNSPSIENMNRYQWHSFRQDVLNAYNLSQRLDVSYRLASHDVIQTSNALNF